jgi:hypothetical protein
LHRPITSNLDRSRKSIADGRRKEILLRQMGQLSGTLDFPDLKASPDVRLDAFFSMRTGEAHEVFTVFLLDIINTLFGNRIDITTLETLNDNELFAGLADEIGWIPEELISTTSNRQLLEARGLLCQLMYYPCTPKNRLPELRDIGIADEEIGKIWDALAESLKTPRWRLGIFFVLLKLVVKESQLRDQKGPTKR